MVDEHFRGGVVQIAKKHGQTDTPKQTQQKATPINMKCTSSFIRTIPSALELHQICYLTGHQMMTIKWLAGLSMLHGIQ
jgi:hypothetical protein